MELENIVVNIVYLKVRESEYCIRFFEKMVYFVVIESLSVVVVFFLISL